MTPSGAQPSRGRFIAFEGGEGCGKSTQARRLAQRIGALLTHEPGGTRLGKEIRSLLLEPSHGELDARAEALLMAADRAQHVAEVVRPALDRGEDVIADRYAGSSLAYQGFGRGLAVDALEELSNFAADGLWPDLVLLLDLVPEAAALRVTSSPDRIEGAGPEFHARVREGYLALARRWPDRWVVIDAAQDVDAVEAAVWSTVLARWSRS
jgi:dTMP kinase